MPNEIDQAVDQVLSSELATADENEILRQLDVELQQQTEAQAMVLSGEEPPAWVLGDEQAGGFGSMAQRFIGFYGDALYKEICDPQQGRMKDQYRNLVGGADTNDRVRALAPVVLGALGIGASLVNPAAIAAIVALWLVRLGLDQWCALPRSQGGATSASGSGAAPMVVDPSVAPSSPAPESGAAPQ